MNPLKEFFQDKSIHTVLDIATGKGQFIKILSEIFPHTSFTGVDPDEESLKTARENFSGADIPFLPMEAENLKFNDCSFDIVSISNGLHHLPELELSLEEMKRVLKSDGHIIISELVNDHLNPAQENQKFYHHLKSYVDRRSGHFHHETWSRQEILEIIKKNNIRIELVFDYFDGKNFITETENIDFWVNRLKEHLDVLKDEPVYQKLIPKIKEFRERLAKDGMKHANNVVVLGRKINR